MSTAAAIVLAAYFAGLAVLGAFTRNGRRIIYVTALAVHRRLVPATGTHRPKDPETGEVLPEEAVTVRAVLRELVLTAWWHVRNWTYAPVLWWRVYQINRAIRQLRKEDQPEMLRDPVAASDPGDGPAPATAVPGAGPLTDATAAVSPYPPPTAPQPALREQLEPVTAARPYVSAGEGILS